MTSSKLATAKHFGVASLLFIGFCISANAANPESTARERETAAEKFVAQKVQLWQERLNLKDWNIICHMMTRQRLRVCPLVVPATARPGARPIGGSGVLTPSITIRCTDAPPGTQIPG